MSERIRDLVDTHLSRDERGDAQLSAPGLDAVRRYLHEGRRRDDGGDVVAELLEEIGRLRLEGLSGPTEVLAELFLELAEVPQARTRDPAVDAMELDSNHLRAARLICSPPGRPLRD